MSSKFLIHRLILLDLRYCWSIIAYLEALYVASPQYSVGCRPRPAPGLFYHIFSQCESVTDLVIDRYEDIKFLYFLGEWPGYLGVTICTADLNPNLHT